MSRHRSSRLGRWLHALGVAVAYIAVTASLLSLNLGDLGLAPPWAVVVAPPIVYALLSRVFLRRVSLTRRLSWIGGACLTHVTLGVAAATVVGILDTLTPLSALAHVFVRLGPGPFLTLAATPLVLAPFGGRVLSSRPAPRAERTRQPVVFTPVTPGQTPFAREPRRRDSTPEPPATPAAEMPATPAAEMPAAPPESPQDDAIVRVRFERVANQLPANAFTLPLDRVAESLREPHWLTVPRRVVVAQLAEGAVQVDWAIVASQFPPLAFSVTDVEFRRQHPDLKLTLPMDDVLRQLPRGVLSTGGSPSQIAGLDAFPPPFEPLAVPREVPGASPVASDAQGPPPDVVIAPPAAAPVARPAPVPAPEPLRFATAAPMIAPPPPTPIAPPPLAPIAPPPPARIAPPPPAPVAPPPPEPIAPPPPDPVAESLRFSAPVAPPPVAPTRVSAPAPPPAPAREVPSEVIDREALGRLAACFAGAGTFESWSGVVEGVPLVAFLAPSMARAAVTAVAARVAGLLGAAAGEQVTVRTARAAIVVTAAPMPVVVAAPRPGSPVALLELRGARAAALVGRAGEGAAPPSRALSVLTVDRRVADVAGTLAAFGEVEPAVLTDASGTARVYVFREPGREAERLGELALAVWDGLGRPRDADLGALVSVVFRQGRRRILVRALGGPGTALLAAAGPVARPGRAWREVDRAAAALEAR